MSDCTGTVFVSSHMRNGHEVSSYTRSCGGSHSDDESVCNEEREEDENKDFELTPEEKNKRNLWVYLGSGLINFMKMVPC